VLKSVSAAIVNHNTSSLAEIALRSLRWAADRSGTAVNLSIVDNHSTDDTRALRSAVEECGAGWESSRWPVGGSTLNTHGDVLRDFVLARPDADGFLFVDSDICFLELDALAVMLSELDAEPGLWAVQARLLTSGQVSAATFNEAVHRKRRPVLLSARMTVEGDDGRLSVKDFNQSGRRMGRCHPGCALIRNTDAFRLAARHLGFSASWTWSNDPRLAGLSDTLSMVSRAMYTHHMRHIISTASVIHFWHGTSTGLGQGHERLLRHLRAGDVPAFLAECARAPEAAPASVPG
jgi:hypothetical protein